jgi:hypothetical protein
VVDLPSTVSDSRPSNCHFWPALHARLRPLRRGFGSATRRRPNISKRIADNLLLPIARATRRWRDLRFRKVITTLRCWLISHVWIRRSGNGSNYLQMGM